MSATVLPSGGRSGPSRENQNVSVSVGGVRRDRRPAVRARTGTPARIRRFRPRCRRPARRTRPVRTIAAVVPASWASMMATPPHPSTGRRRPRSRRSGAAPGRGPPGGPAGSGTKKSRGADARRPNALSETAVGRFLTCVPRRATTRGSPVCPMRASGVAGRHGRRRPGNGRQTLGPKRLRIIVGSSAPLRRERVQTEGARSLLLKRRREAGPYGVKSSRRVGAHFACAAGGSHGTSTAKRGDEELPIARSAARHRRASRRA